MTQENWSLPAKDGLYDPQLEKDACGVGFIVAIDGKRSHKVTQYCNRNVVCCLAMVNEINNNNNHEAQGPRTVLNQIMSGQHIEIPSL